MSRAIVLITLASCWLTACNTERFESAGSGAATGMSGANGAGAGGTGPSSGGTAAGGTTGGGSTGGAAVGGATAGSTGAGSGGVAAGGEGGGSAGTSMPGGGTDAGGTANGGAPGCGDIGSACVNDCPAGLACNSGLCVPDERPPCGGFNPVECPDTRPHCLYCSGCDFGDCFTAAELVCVCSAPNVDDVYSGCE